MPFNIKSFIEYFNNGIKNDPVKVDENLMLDLVSRGIQKQWPHFSEVVRENFHREYYRKFLISFKVTKNFSFQRNDKVYIKFVGRPTLKIVLLGDAMISGWASKDIRTEEIND